MDAEAGKEGRVGGEVEVRGRRRAGGGCRPAEVLLNQVGVHVAELHLQELHQGQNGLGRGGSTSGSGPFWSHPHAFALARRGNGARSVPKHLWNVCRASP